MGDYIWIFYYISRVFLIVNANKDKNIYQNKACYQI